MNAESGDLVVHLRVVGQKEPSITVETDEGDGYDFIIKDKNIPRKSIKQWIEQLEYITHYLRNKTLP